MFRKSVESNEVCRIRFHRNVFGFLGGVVSLLLPTVVLAQPSTYTISTIAGTGGTAYQTIPGSSGDGGAALLAYLNGPISVVVDSAHNIYFSDSNNNKIRVITGNIISTFAGKLGYGYSGDLGPAINALFYSPCGLFLDSSGNMWVGDTLNQVIRVISGGIVNTVAGNNTNGFSGDFGPAINAQLREPFGATVDSAGNLYVSDTYNNRVRKVAPNGTITTYAGNGLTGNIDIGDGGPALNAALTRPSGLAVDAAGNLYIADAGYNRIRRVDTKGIITTFAGTGIAGGAGDGGPAVNAQLSLPWALTFDTSGDLFVADYGNSRIRVITPDGIIHTIAGGTGYGYTGDGFIASNAQLSFPSGVAVDSSTGKVYIADSDNNVIRMLTPYPPSINSGGVVSASAFGGFSSVAPGSWIEIYGANLSVDRRSWAASDFKGVNAPTAVDGTTVTIGGQPAFIDYISGGQVNVQVPSNVPTGAQPLIVKTAAGTSNTYTVNVTATQPGLLAPATFQVNGTQYLAALLPDGQTYAAPPGAIAGVTSQRAKAGDIITLYGVGFGNVTPNIPAGQIVQQNNTLALPLTISIGGTQATVKYQGLAPNYVGLYQFDVVVPSVVSSDRVPVTFSLGGASGAQTLYMAVQ